jgi:hypothetical protein
MGARGRRCNRENTVRGQCAVGLPTAHDSVPFGQRQSTSTYGGSVFARAPTASAAVDETALRSRPKRATCAGTAKLLTNIFLKQGESMPLQVTLLRFDRARDAIPSATEHQSAASAAMPTSWITINRY